MSMPLVSIVILNYNSGDYLQNCLESIYKSDYENFEVIVVDNNSHDKSYLKCKKFQNLILIENPKNVGFSEGNNIGIRKAKGEYIVILNPDTIVTKSWLSELLNASINHGDGIYQPKILSLENKNEIQGTGVMIHLFGFGFTRDRGMINSEQEQNVEQISCASGACMFLSNKIFKKIGLFDPFLFLYLDDLEFGWRAAQMGIKSFFVPKSAIYHAESPNLKWTSKKFFWLERNRKYCLQTHYSKNTYKKIWFYLFLTDLMIWIFYISKGFMGAKINAEIDIFKNRKSIRKKYQDIEKNKNVSDADIIDLFSNTIFVPQPVASSKLNDFFNSVIKHLSKRARLKIKKLG